ncbi:universal stress protein [Massilia sp. DWR3-1-1]|uniref:universal stress protein n=1 Tax=Massilia sp. DWR3-1-1 TaxID=2804559 RepID=UPI003CEB3181
MLRRPASVAAVASSPQTYPSDEAFPGAALQACLACHDIGVELIVMGCFGHSRLREIVLGGATGTVLRETTVPVLMAH